ncbi:hypothetical protein [Alienimonas sp. DA493]|uniref:hypothetical protein n=1 Tax=Alienimonas sp. DA493 TaxID=3373605 RepID=UPI0037546D79
MPAVRSPLFRRFPALIACLSFGVLPLVGCDADAGGTTVNAPSDDVEAMEAAGREEEQYN